MARAGQDHTLLIIRATKALPMPRPHLLLFVVLLHSACLAADQGDGMDSLWRAYQAPHASGRERLISLHEIVRAMRNVDQDSSKALAQKMLREAERAQDTLMTALAYRDLGIAELMVRANDPAMAYLEQALRLYRTKQDSTFRVGAGAVLSTMAMAQKNAGHLDKAMDLYRESLAMHHSANDPHGAVYCYNGMGRIREIQGQGDSALAYYGRVVRSSRELHMADMEAGGYGNLANVHASMGHIGEAIDMAYRSLTISEQIGDVRGTAACLTTVSSLKASMGDRGSSLDLLRRALALYKQVDYRQGVMTASSSIGELLLSMGKADSATVMLEHALGLERAADAQDLMGNTLRNLGAAYRETGRIADAEALLNEAVQLAQRLGDRTDEALAVALLGRVELDRGHAREAVRYCTNGLALAGTNTATDEYRDNCECLYLANKAMGNGAAALKYHESYIISRDTLTNARARNELTRRDLLYDFSKQQLADSMQHTSERTRLEGERTIEAMRADQNRNRGLATGAGALVLLGGIAAWAVTDRKRRHERFEKEAATLETQALRSQMNPHFIFNALNSINAFVQRNDQDSATSYLAKFARLMRLVLENSRHAEVPLASDLEALRGYLDLERMRLDGKFDFSIGMGPGIDPDTVLVPPLVVQPFVENAIWHGVSGMAGKGHISLSIQKRDTTLLWTIEDDGAGRTVKTPDSGVPSKKTSLGTTITRARLDLVRKQHGGTAGFRYTDLPKGTRVEVEMPLLEG